MGNGGSMENVMIEKIYRKIFLIDDFDAERDLYHDLFTGHNNYRYVITGPSKCGKTSLLFETAFQAAKKGLKVLYITSKQITTLPHFHGSRKKPDTEILSRIQLLYPATYEECLSILGSVHTMEAGYNLIMVNDIEDFFVLKDRSRLVQCCSLLMAILIDAAAFCETKTSTTTMLLCSVSSDSPLYSSLLGSISQFIMNEIRFYATPNQQRNRATTDAPCFVIKSETRVLSLKNQVDIDVIGVQAKFKDNRIFLK